MNNLVSKATSNETDARMEPSLSEKGDSFIISPDDPVLVTGAAGFIGSRVVEGLLSRGFRNLVCFARPSGKLAMFEDMMSRRPLGTQIKLIRGNLLSRQDCEAACKDAALIIHLAAGTGDKSFPDAFMNSVVATRNLLEAGLKYACLRRIVLVSSFAVYSNRRKPRGRLLDESCPIEEYPELRGEAYCFAKIKQERLVAEFGRMLGLPYVVVRPGSVYGPGKGEITGRVGIGTFGFFLHMGGNNTIPFTYVDNCADAIILAGLVKGIEGEVFNIVDDDLPTSRRFLHIYKRNVKRFRSVYLPHFVSYGLSYAWEKYSQWSEGQVPPVFNRQRWHAEWKKTLYSNEKLKRLGWVPRVPTAEGLRRAFQNSGSGERDA
jgi:nucleoside-diphosphate-sugar epimerase